MELGVLVGFETLDNFEQHFANLCSCGFSTCQLCSWHPDLWTDENVEMIKGLLKKYNVRISAFWCGWEGPCGWNLHEGPLCIGLIPQEYRLMRMKNLCDGADFAKKLGVTDVITHMGFIPENPADPVYRSVCVAIRYVAEHLKANGQNLLFETGQETPLTLLRCINDVGTDNLGINLDTANLILYGKGNPVDALDVFGKYVRNMHAKDGVFSTDGMKLGEEKRLGDGVVDFVKLFQKLKALNYDSYVTIEREIDGEEQIADVMYAKKFLEDIISETYGK